MARAAATISTAGWRRNSSAATSRAIRPSCRRTCRAAAASRRSLYLYQVAPQDGTYLGSVSQQFASNAVTDEKNKMDVTRFHYLGRFTSNIDVGVALPQAGIKSFEEARKRQIVVGAENGSMSLHLRPGAQHLWGRQAQDRQGLQRLGRHPARRRARRGRRQRLLLAARRPGLASGLGARRHRQYPLPERAQAVSPAAAGARPCPS